MRERLCKHCSQFHPLDAWPRACVPERRNLRSPLGVPYIKTDGMDATMNHADGRLYDSKSQYERAVKAAGCEIVGNDMGSSERSYTEAPDLDQDIKTAIEQVEAGHHA